ncbi:hypothetical protein [Microbacterium sp. W4I4]|uniref:hypothetical protein n=1 Tax=Microbacterium sp. W4I4 TaxID=3042295 RepID=UPI0027D89E1D|nr:hypothetical protein [Microbacterium sp. W4I4]
MRFTSVDNRSRSMWLLVGLGVLIWAAFSVFLSGSSAHADETPGPSAKHSQHQTSPQAAERSAHGVTQAASEVLRVITAPTAPVVTALREAAPQQAAPSQLVAAPEPTEAIKSITAQVTSALHQKPEARSILQDATKITKKIASHARQARAAVPVRAHGAPAKHPRATHADHHPAPTAAPMAHLQVAKHASLAASAPVRTAAASATLTRGIRAHLRTLAVRLGRHQHASPARHCAVRRIRRGRHHGSARGRSRYHSRERCARASADRGARR